MPLKIDPELQAILASMPPMPVLEPPKDHLERRARGNTFLKAFSTGEFPEDVERKEYQVTSHDGQSISVYGFAKKDAQKNSPAILHMHGGGMIAGNVPLFFEMLGKEVSQTGVPHYSVEYRLPPEHPHPTPVEDGYAALVWLRDNASQLSIDPKRIGVKGESAGGGLAAALVLLARDRKFEPLIAKQILVYPMLDDRNTVPDEEILATKLAFWNYEDNYAGWKALIGDNIGKEGVSYHAAPARAPSVEGLPPTYIDVGTLDIFREECKLYAKRLEEAGIQVEFHLYEGVPHGFDGLGPTTTIGKNAIKFRRAAITGF